MVKVPSEVKITQAEFMRIKLLKENVVWGHPDMMFASEVGMGVMEK